MDVLCFSHLRWDFVYQRPQHLMSRYAENDRVFFIEEPVWQNGAAKMEVKRPALNIYVVTPHLPDGVSETNPLQLQQKLLADVVKQYKIDSYVAWFYTPMSIDLLAGLVMPKLVVYDCMDELSMFRNAPVEMQQKEHELFDMADLVFTGGNLLYESKKALHDNIHSFPSSIDKEHFQRARKTGHQPADQETIEGTKIGFFGVIDERMDLGLIDAIAEKCPKWSIILIGPVVKIDPAKLPRRPNIYYLGGKTYDELPNYLSGWDVALIPFAQNDSTRFISPTKTPEYLAGGKPVVSTPIHDVIHPYGDDGLVYIGASVDDFISGIKWSLEIKRNPEWLRSVDIFLKDLSWDYTWRRMSEHIDNALLQNQRHLSGVELS
ncbi:glycosyltransferase [Terrimonas sp. NA20]|uniref:Glycosyltransferase n=1 Tax=Terrimonas ginsenosidimutans TaxID=2908004 RepID=A0ABS9KS22_9BACT|nr:glycosyltransferase [Terrimonas ginsenosidimutans]MCG2615125.1 glycosyltransferase [Terrimonas ginsenosidimutans]